MAGEADNAESSGGLVGWITKKAGQAWEAIKLELELVILPIQGFADQVIAFLPMDNIRNVRETVTDFPGKAASMSESLGQPDDVENNQATLRDEILPGILETIAVFLFSPSPAARFRVLVLLATPPFWLAKPMTRVPELSLPTWFSMAPLGMRYRLPI